MQYKTISARVDLRDAQASKAILERKGISISVAIRTMLILTAENGELPFEI